MKKIQFTFLALLLIGCAKDLTVGDTAFTDAELIPYVNQFLKLATEHGTVLDASRVSRIVIVFDAATVYPILGKCTVSTKGLSIKINPENWQYASKAEREQLMFHELGHCLMGLQHDNTVAKLYDYNSEIDGFYSGAANLMNAYAIWGEWYEPNRTYYINKLFNFNTPQPVKMYYNSPSQFNENLY